MSYTGNEVILPRKKTSDIALKMVRLSELVKPSSEILLCEYTDQMACIVDSSASGGANAVKSHRPTSGISDGGAVWGGGEAGTCANPQALTVTEAEAARAAAISANGASGRHHIVYTKWDMHGNRQNYIFADGHVAAKTLAETLDPNDFLWGKKVYVAFDKPEIVTNK
jgi:prepilin-type processing-associated H-X9-DG protein